MADEADHVPKLLARLAGHYRKQLDEADRARIDLADSIREAAAAGLRQADIVRATGYTREQVRRIVAGRTR